MYKIGPLLANLLKVDERDDILFTTPIDYISLMLPKLTCSICLKGVSKITSRDNKYLRIEVQYSLYYFLVFDSEIKVRRKYNLGTYFWC